MNKSKDRKTKEVKPLSRYQSYRAQRALQDGREPEKNGRLQYLNDEEEDLLENIILLDAAGSDFLTFDEICQLNKMWKLPKDAS
ncbi:MAG: hypothetical protein EZS28_028774 [Streblomastix strix]|uniref:Uncharacterized protein n=1 Tax=Streblomastix strix TaxID=222440 RepID=A0A5J4UZ57_9EUKA|nr:MAG: hypothetical protein EZS28_028774 [Streblomastix strix]